MTMPRGASRALYTGNGQAAEFPFFFRVFEEDQLSVLVTSPAGVTTEAAGWTAELDGSGGTVRYLHNGAPLPEGWKLAIMRDMPFVQEVDLITGTRFDPEVIETALDVATAERQQLLERLDRAVVVEPTDEAGPQALLADIRDARASAGASATSAAANANAAATSAQSAAGSAAVAAEQREAACICAGEAQAARDVAIAQTEAANTLMEAELSKVNAIVAANRTDQQAAVTAARAWAEKAPDTPVDYDDEGNPRYSARHWAKCALETVLDPDGVTVGLDDDGALHALGGNLLMTSEVWITESGTWTAPVAGWYDLWVIGGGAGAYGWSSGRAVLGGDSGCYVKARKYLQSGQEVPVTIGAGGIAKQAPDENYSTDLSLRKGGNTAFGDLIAYGGQAPIGNEVLPKDRLAFPGEVDVTESAESSSWSLNAGGGGPSARGFYGAGGGAGSTGIYSSLYSYTAKNGVQGAVRACYHDPAKAAGPVAAPAPLSARRMAPRAVSAPVTVNLYDPETGQGSVWREEEAEAKLAEGLISEAAWLAICAEKAAEEREAWLQSPDTAEQRFQTLRAARDARLGATDYLVAPDYPLAAEQRAAVMEYRQALRDLPAQEGAPWDGGGELTPWPALPLACGGADEAAAGAGEGDGPCA